MHRVHSTIVHSVYSVQCVLCTVYSVQCVLCKILLFAINITIIDNNFTAQVEAVYLIDIFFQIISK